jgi:adenylate cyclase
MEKGYMADTTNREIRRGTALIVDVVNFYRQQPHGLEATGDMLDDLYNTIAGTVIAFHGEIIKWLGDGALACFWGTGHEMAGLHAAVALHEEFDAFARRHGFSESGLTISVATGDMLYGDFGTGEARHIDVFGEPVNCTATIMPEASGEITICEATYAAVKASVKVSPLAEHPYYGPLYAVQSLDV